MGAPISAPSSIKSKSSTRFKAAITTTPKLKSIPILLLPDMIPISEPKKPITKLIKYKIAIPPVAATTPNLKFSVAFIRPDIYANKRAPKVPNVRNTACTTIPGYCASKIIEITPKNTPWAIAYAGTVI